MRRTSEITRRGFLAAPALGFLSACRRNDPYFRGFAFIANQDGGAVAALDLDVFAVAKHIPVGGSPSQILASRKQPAVYALTPDTGSVHEIQTETLKVGRRASLTGQPVQMALAPDSGQLYVVSRETPALIAISADTFRPNWRLALPEEPVGFSLSGDGKTAALTSANSVRLIDLGLRKIGAPLGHGGFGQVRFLNNGSGLIAADLEARRLSIYSVEQSRLITHLPLAVRPEQMCFNADGGQLFVTGEGMDAVVVVFPFNTPMVAETVLAGNAPGAMAASGSPQFLFVASPGSGDVSILNITTRRVIAVAPVGMDPGFIAITPDNEFALVLNRESGDVAVLRIPTITPNRYKSAALLTVIPVGSRPISADFHAV